MNCPNSVTYFIPRGYSHFEMAIPCGSTDYRGDRAVCETCGSSPVITRSLEDHEASVRADNDWLRSAGWGEL